MFARVILPAGGGPRLGDAFSQGKRVKERLRRWRQGEYRQLWDEAVQLTKPPAQAKRRQRRTGESEVKEKTQEEKNAVRAGKLAQDGQYTKSLQSLTSAGMADHSRATKEEMKAKHPSATHSSTFQSTTTAAQMVFTQKEVFNAVKSFRRGSAAGPSGLRPEHLKVAVKSPSPNKSDRALEALTKVVNLAVAGKVPEAVAPFLCGARLHAANKKAGGIRPIAVGNLLRRLVSKLVSFGLAHKVASKLAPHQLGVGVRGGCEAIVHAVRQALEDGDVDQWVLQADLINAFNMGDRDTAFEEMEQNCPEGLKWVLTCYGADSELLFGDIIIFSSIGFHQGDPLASLLFALLLHPIILLIKHNVPALDLNAWYLDDGTLVGTKKDLRQAVEIFRREGPARGLHLSTSVTVLPPALPKSTVWCPTGYSSLEADPLQCGIPSIVESGIILLGSPVGDLEWEQEAIKSRVKKVKETTDRLQLLQDPQTEFVLLRSCLALPKVMHLLRSVDPSSHLEIWKDFDRITREALTRILGVPIFDLPWAQAKLPVSQGGLGLRAAEDHGPAAYAASFLSSQPLLRDLLHLPDEESSASLPPILLQILSMTQGEEATTESLESIAQKDISFKIDTKNRNLLKEAYTREGRQREVARLESLGLQHAGDWLNVVPSPPLGLHLRGLEFSMLVKYRLGIPLYARSGQCPACSKDSDRLGDHAMCCGTGGERIARHNHLRDSLHAAAVSAALGPTKEERFLLPGSGRRPGDVFIPHWTGGRDTALDVTVVNPLQAATVAGAATTPGFALTFAYERKLREVEEACRRQGILFLPLAVESLGGWHEVAIDQIRKLGGALARHTGEEEGVVVQRLFQKLSLQLMKGNAAILTNRIPDSQE